MSKVFKQSSLFIPEKIIPGKKDGLPGWQSVSLQERQAEPSSPDTGHKRLRQQGSHELDFSGTNGNEHANAAHKTDFTTPDASLRNGRDAETTDLDGDLETVAHPEPVDLETLKEEAYNRGLQDGLARAEEDFGSSAKALIMVCREINVLRETILNNSLDELQNLVLAIAEKIIRHSITEQDRTIIDTVREAIHQAVKSDELVIQINPADLTIINAKSKEFIDSVSGLENIVVKADPSIERGGCTIDSSTSMVDATITGQLQIIGNALHGKT